MPLNVIVVVKVKKNSHWSLCDRDLNQEYVLLGSEGKCLLERLLSVIYSLVHIIGLNTRKRSISYPYSLLPYLIGVSCRIWSVKKIPN